MIFFNEDEDKLDSENEVYEEPISDRFPKIEELDVIIDKLYNVSNSYFSSTIINKQYNKDELRNIINESYKNKDGWVELIIQAEYIIGLFENQFSFKDELDNFDLIFIYVLYTKSTEGLLADFVKKIHMKKNILFTYIFKHNKKHTISFLDQNWRKGLTIIDYENILYSFLVKQNYEETKIEDLRIRIKTLLRDDRNRYIHLDKLEGFENLKNKYIEDIYTLVLILLSMLQ